jgi:hypothetical protein
MTIKVLTPDEIQKLKLIQQTRFQLNEKFGEIELNIQELKFKKEKLTEDLFQLIKEETIIGKELQQKYGDGTINLEKGEFTGN